jgi:hypothetical protein
LKTKPLSLALLIVCEILLFSQYRNIQIYFQRIPFGISKWIFCLHFIINFNLLFCYSLFLTEFHLSKLQSPNRFPYFLPCFIVSAMALAVSISCIWLPVCILSTRYIHFVLFLPSIVTIENICINVGDIS